MAKVRYEGAIEDAKHIKLYDGQYIIIYKDLDQANELKVIKDHVTGEFDEPFSLQDAVDKCGEGVYLVIFESWLDGEIWRYGNYEKGVFDLSGKMKGFA